MTSKMASPVKITGMIEEDTEGLQVGLIDMEDVKTLEPKYK